MTPIPRLWWAGEDGKPLPQFMLNYRHVMIPAEDSERVERVVRSTLGVGLLTPWRLLHWGDLVPAFFQSVGGHLTLEPFNGRTQLILAHVSGKGSFLFGGIEPNLSELAKRISGKLGLAAIASTFVQPPEIRFFNLFEKSSVFAQCAGSRTGEIKDLYENLIPIARKGHRPSTEEERAMLLWDCELDLSEKGASLRPFFSGTEIPEPTMRHIIVRTLGTP